MENKFQSNSDGRVGGALPPYRDHHVTHKQNIFWKHVGLDTSFKEHSGLLDQRELS